MAGRLRRNKKGAAVFLLRFLGLGLLALFCYAMASIPSHEANWIAGLFAPLFFLFAPLFYFLPTIEAWIRSHNNLGGIAALNFFLGWTLIGWVGALVWALARPARAEVVNTPSSPDSPSGQYRTAPSAPTNKPDRECPHCAELIKAAAKVCKHCGRDVEPVAAAAPRAPYDNRLAETINAARRDRDQS